MKREVHIIMYKVYMYFYLNCNLFYLDSKMMEYIAYYIIYKMI